MGRAYEKGVQRLRQAQKAIGQPPERTEPRTRKEIESFIKGFGMSAAATRQIVNEWHTDQTLSYRAGYADAHSSYAHD
jgi:hypothetical protein